MTKTFEVEVGNLTDVKTYVVTGEELTLKQAHDAALRDARQMDNPTVHVICAKELHVIVLATEE